MHPARACRGPVLVLSVALALIGTSGRAPGAPAGGGQEPGPTRQEFTVTARICAFSPARIEVAQDALVKITFTTQDIPHSFTLDKYRIAKRVSPGQTVVFEFRADQPGTFPFSCNLTMDERCRDMRGELVVKGR